MAYMQALRALQALPILCTDTHRGYLAFDLYMSPLSCTVLQTLSHPPFPSLSRLAPLPLLDGYSVQPQ
jgi:hypothetical protein